LVTVLPATTNIVAQSTRSAQEDQARLSGLDSSGRKALLDRYCVTCHNGRVRAGGLLLDQADVTHVGDGAEIWEKVVRKLRAGMMPPAGARRPEGDTLVRFAADLEHELSAGRPVVLGLLLPYDNNHNASHYEVAVAMNPRDGTVVTIDPATGDWRKRSRPVLDLEWKSAGFAALVVVGPHSPAVARTSPAQRATSASK